MHTNSSSLYTHSLQSGYVMGRKIAKGFQHSFVSSDWAILFSKGLNTQSVYCAFSVCLDSPFTAFPRLYCSISKCPCVIFKMCWGENNKTIPKPRIVTEIVALFLLISFNLCWQLHAILKRITTQSLPVSSLLQEWMTSEQMLIWPCLWFPCWREGWSCVDSEITRDWTC